MKIDTKHNNILNCPFKQYYFWEHKLLKGCNFFEGYFETKFITKESKFVYTGILDYEKSILHYGFVVYPSIYKLLGFLQHIFLPTAFFTWFDHKSNGFFIPLASYEIVVKEVVDYTNNIDLNSVALMNDSFSFLENAWALDNTSLTLSLKSFCEKFNNKWDNGDNKKLFIKIFDTPSDIFHFIKNSIGWSDYNDFIEEEISMSLDTLKFTCDNALTEPLLNKKYIDILNINIPILF